MLCPRCNVELATLGVSRGRANGCERCHGLWLDEAAAQALLDEGAESLAARAKGTRPDHDEARTLRCPACSRPMDKRELHYVQLDQCVGHGTWFDAGELEFVARGVVEMRARQAAEARLSPGERYARNGEVLNAELHSVVSSAEDDAGSDFGSDPQY